TDGHGQTEDEQIGPGGQGRTEAHRGHAQTDTDRQRDPDGQRGTGTYKGNRRGQTRTKHTRTWHAKTWTKHPQRQTGQACRAVDPSVGAILFTTVTFMDQDRPFGSEKDRVKVR
ncbi:hypothetical protein V3C99_013106, partial [Haemonchus contortus]